MLEFVPISKKKSLIRKISVQCHFCHKSFMDYVELINNLPSIALYGKVSEDGIKEAVRFSSFYNDYTYLTKLEVPDNTITQFFCPHCDTDLTSDLKCKLCNAPMIDLQLTQGGMLEFCVEAYERRLKKEPSADSFSGLLHFCSRKGCQNQMIHFKNPDADLKAFYELFAPFLD